MSMNLMLRRVPAIDQTSVCQQESSRSVPSLKLFDGGDDISDSDIDYDFDEVSDDEFLESLSSGGSNVLSLEKAWHGLHYLLTGDPWGGNGTRGFMLTGGTEQGDDLGYGPARYFDPEEVREISDELNGITEGELWSNFDARQMTSSGVYPNIWGEPVDDLQEEYFDYFQMLKEFLAQTADHGEAMQILMV